MDYSLERDELFSILDTTLSTLDIDELLTTVVTRIRKVLGAERATFFLIDREPEELYSKVLSDDRLSEIRIPLKETSLAGFTALRGRPVVVRDAYDAGELRAIDPDLRFDANWDAKSGFRTRSVLAVPVRTKDGVVGVLQALNKTGGFTERDLGKMEEVAFVLGIAVHNAMLYRLLEGEYRFTQHIIDMIDDGVCLLNGAGAILSANRSMEAMCGRRFTAETMRGKGIFEMFPQFAQTPLLDGLQRVLKSGLETRVCLDAVVVRIAPYHDEEGKVTRLVLIFGEVL